MPRCGQFVLATLLIGCFAAAPSAAQSMGPDQHEQHHQQHQQQHQPGSPAGTTAATTAPRLRILLPAAGSVLGTTMAVLFEGPADLPKLTMSQPGATKHLHVALDDLNLMPVADQLIRMGPNQYLYLFDLPVEPGPRTVSVFWADAKHEVIEASRHSVKVTVAP